jgi:PAS domain S-box-containing protein
MEYDFTPEMLEALAANVEPEQIQLVRELGLRSWIVVPILAGEQVMGAISMIAAESDRLFGPDDLAFAENLAARVAVAIQNARAFREAVRYKRVLDATLDAVIVFDPASLRISYANQGAMDQLGYAEADLVGADATMVVEDLDAIGLRGLVEPLVTGALDARTATLSYRHVDGRSVPVEVLLQHVIPAGEAGRIVAVARDIGDRIEAQANLRRLAESEHARAAELNAVIRAMGDGIFVCDAAGRISLSNPPPRTCSRTSTRRRTTRSSPRWRTPSTRRRRSGRSAGRSSSGPAVRGALDRAQHVPGRPRGRRPGRRPCGAETIVMLRDSTVARRQQLIRDTFIGVLSHELRTPVTTIYAGSKVLSRDGDELPEETRREIFSDIVVESERLHRLVEDVIAMTRFGEDEGDVGTEPVLVQRILPAVIRSERARWPGRHVRAQPAARACRPRSPTRPTSSRSCGTCSRTRRSTAAPARRSRSTSSRRRRGHRPRHRRRARASRTRKPSASSSCSSGPRARPRPPQAPGSASSSAPASSGRWAAGSGRSRSRVAGRSSGSPSG